MPGDVLFTHPPQRQVELVRTLGRALDEHAFVQVDPTRAKRRSRASTPLVDSTSRMQTAIAAAAQGVQAAAAINGDLAMELAVPSSGST